MATSRQKTLLGTLLVLGTLLLYGPAVVHHEFLSFDDRQYVVRNLHVNTGLSLVNFRWAFTAFEQANWHPLTWLSHMLDCQLFGINSGAHHLVNVLLHAANALLLFVLLQKATRAVWRSFLVAAMFAVHPLNVETVAWLAERKSLLSMLFSLSTSRRSLFAGAHVEADGRDGSAGSAPARLLAVRKVRGSSISKKMAPAVA